MCVMVTQTSCIPEIGPKSEVQDILCQAVKIFTDEVLDFSLWEEEM